MIYTTNAIESLHMQLRKIVKNRGHFPNDLAAKKLRFLALRNIEKNRKRPPVHWKHAANPFAILFGIRLTNTMTRQRLLPQPLTHKIPGSTCRCAGQSAGFYTHGCQMSRLSVPLNHSLRKLRRCLYCESSTPKND